jgi:hypothetical protein
MRSISLVLAGLLSSASITAAVAQTDPPKVVQTGAQGSETDPEETESSYFVVGDPAADRPLLHSWRATLDIGQSGGPLEDAEARVGYSRTREAKLGLEFGISSRGFARIEAIRSRRNTKRTLEFDDLKGDADEHGIGVTGGVFLLPFIAAGLSVQYRAANGTDEFINRAVGTSFLTDRDDRSRRVASFLLLTAPVGPVNASLLGAYVDLRTSSEYTNDPNFSATPTSSDSGSVKASLLDASVAWRMTPDIEIGGSIGWTHITAQRVQADALPLDTDTGTVGAHVSYRLTDSLDVSLRGSQDFANRRGNGTRFGGGLAYRF